MLIGICGGIGSGKSVVSRILRLNGFTVYDCDLEAKNLMDNDAIIKRRIRDEISADVTDGIRRPDRRLLAEIVFSDEEARLKLNKVVHRAVRDDIERRREAHPLMWIESAILAESGLADQCDRIWNVVAPMQLRLERCMQRDHARREDIERRISAQLKEERLLERFEEKISLIHNDDRNSLLEQINKNLQESGIPGSMKYKF